MAFAGSPQEVLCLVGGRTAHRSGEGGWSWLNGQRTGSRKRNPLTAQADPGGENLLGRQEVENAKDQWSVSAQGSQLKPGLPKCP